MRLETERLLLKEFTVNDLEAFALLMTDPEVMRFSLKGPMKDIEQVKEYFQKKILDHYAQHGYGLYAVFYKADNCLIGGIGLLSQDIDGERKTELAYRLHPQYWGKGLATEACLALVLHAFDKLRLKELISIIDPKNIRSLEVAKRIGMKFLKETTFHNIPVQLHVMRSFTRGTIIQTERLLLRSWKHEDLESLAKLYTDHRVMEYSEKVKTYEESKKDYDHFVSTVEERGWGFWATELRDTHQFIGLIGLDNFEFKEILSPAVEIGWRLHYDFWGKGYATEGANAALEYGFESIGLNEVVSFTSTTNKRSRRVMERLGMTHNPKDDFNDPDLCEGHPNRRLVLYRLKKENWNVSKEKSS
jgi:RimJ/RimL family protein N-acetyltransferase